MKGGYKLIDFKKVDITEEDVVIDGIFNSINSTTKRVVATNLNIGGYELKEIELSVIGGEGSYLLQCPLFKIMITDEDGVSCEVFTNDNYSTKKIYCHPITIFNNNTKVCAIELLIFNNIDTEFDKDTLISYLKSSLGRYSLNGSCMDNGKVIITTYVYSANNTLYVIGCNVDGNIISSSSNVLFEDYVNDINTTLIDGVNAIN
ncbi:MAG: hypothetical protein IIZ67_03170 [Bacilli bacterium]|nr:hypothetical protein [Bacilli bacterium]